MVIVTVAHVSAIKDGPVMNAIAPRIRKRVKRLTKRNFVLAKESVFAVNVIAMNFISERIVKWHRVLSPSFAHTTTIVFGVRYTKSWVKSAIT